MLHVGNPIFLPTCLPFWTFPSIVQFLSKSLLAFSKYPFSRRLLINVDEIIFCCLISGFGFTTSQLNFFSFLINKSTFPSLLLPNLKLLLTNINFDFNFLFKISFMK